MSRCHQCLAVLERRQLSPFTTRFKAFLQNNLQVVWSKIFDRDDRYNLAKISYIPYLLSNNINTELVLERPLFEHQFIDRVNKEVIMRF